MNIFQLGGSRIAGFDYMKMPPFLEVVMFGGGVESDALFPTFF